MPISGKCVDIDVDVDVHAFNEFEGSVFSICNVCEAEGLFTYMWDELEVRDDILRRVTSSLTRTSSLIRLITYNIVSAVKQ